MKRKLLFLVAMMAVMSHSLFAQAPADWVNPTGMNNPMYVIAKLVIDETTSTDENDVVAAFINGEVRGVASPDASGKVYLTIGTNAPDGEVITMKAYIDDTDGGYLKNIDIYAYGADVPYDEDNPFTFEELAEVGTNAEPLTLKTVPLNYTITSSVGTNIEGGPETGTITPDIAGPYDAGDDVTFTMTPAEGYEFTNVMVNDGSGSGNVNVFDEEELEEDGSFKHVFQNISHDGTIEVNFAIKTYNLAFTAGPNGTLTGPNPADLEGAYLTEQTSLIYNAIPHATDLGTVTAVPNNESIQFAKWSDDNSTVPVRTLNSVEDDITAIASFILTGWDPESNYNYTMNLVGKIMIDGTASTNPSDLLGAFVYDDEEDDYVCRGIASPDATGMVYLNIGANTISSTPEVVILKIWNSTLGKDCIADFSFNFQNNGQEGTLDNPKEVGCEKNMIINAPAGYLWFSVNIQTNSTPNTAWDPDNYFYEAWNPDPETDDRIIGQTAFAVYNVDQWFGSLTAMDPKKMYRLNLANSHEISLAGTAVDITPISLPAGYTWLGYLPQDTLSINTALANFTGLQNGDRILSQTQFAIYNGTSWQGSLSNMHRGTGYIADLNNASTLTYHDGSAKSAIVTPENVVSPAGFEAPANMKNTMTLIGQLDKASFSDKDVVYAFINGECRGMAPVSTDGNIYLSIGENSDEAQEVSFKVWVDAKGELANIDQTVIFEPLKAVGDLDHPFTFKMSEAGTTDSWMVGKAYPNPFNEQTIIPLWLKESAQVTVNVYNNVGQLVKTVAQAAAKSGVSNIILQKENLDKGVYYYTISINSSSANVLETGKLIIQ